MQMLFTVSEGKKYVMYRRMTKETTLRYCTRMLLTTEHLYDLSNPAQRGNAQFNPVIKKFQD